MSQVRHASIVIDKQFESEEHHFARSLHSLAHLLDIAYYSNTRLPQITQVPVAYYAKTDDCIYKLKKYTDEVPIKTNR